MKKIGMFLAILGCLILSIPVLASEDCWYVANYGDHDWEQTDAVMPTCTDPGYYILECRICGLNQKNSTGGGDGHTWDITASSDASCTTYGCMELTCVICGEVELETLMPYGHNWVETGGVAGNCTTPEYIYYKCTNCGDEKTETGKAAGHSWKDQYIEVSPTCTSSGSMKTQCVVCKETGSRTLGQIAHQYSAWEITTPATDKAKGVKSCKCTMCGNVQKEEFYPEGTLYRGIGKADEVKELQTMLIECGFLNDKADGIFGKKTEQAVKDFQEKNLVTIDGIAWPQTLRLLSKEWKIKTGIFTEEESESLCCEFFMNQDGKQEVVYCKEHAELVDKAEKMLDETQTEAEYLEALNEIRSLWEEETAALYEKWVSVVPDEGKGAVLSSKAMFEASLISKENLWKLKYKDDSVMVLQNVHTTLTEQCAELCGIVFELMEIVTDQEGAADF